MIFPGNMRASLRWLVAGVLVYAGSYFVFFPKTIAFRDEGAYLSFAYVLGQGTLYADQTDVPAESVPFNGHRVSFGSIGVSLALLPFTFAGWRAVFLYGFLFHLLGTFFFTKILGLFKLSPGWALLYLHYPAFVLYSRTIMGDLPSSALMTAGYYYYLRGGRWNLASGLAWSLCLFLRPQNAVLIFPFVVAGALIIRSRKMGEWISLLCGMAPGLSLIAFLNAVQYGAPWKLGYSQQLDCYSLTNLPGHAGHYLLALTLVYPLMLPLAVFFRQYWRVEAIIASLIFIFFYCIFCFYDRFHPWPATTVFGIRYILPMIPMMLVPYAGALEQVTEKFRGAGTWLSVCAVFLMAGSVAVQVLHQRQLRDQWRLTEAVYQNTEPGATVFYDFNSSELIQKAWGERVYRRFSDMRELTEQLRMADINKRAYLVTRDVIYAGQSRIPGLEESDFKALSARYRLQLQKEEDGLKIYRIQPGAGAT